MRQSIIKRPPRPDTLRADAGHATYPRDRVLDVMPQPLVITDPNLPDNPIVYANRAFTELTGYRSEDVIGKNCRFLCGPATDAETVAEIRQAIIERRACSVEILNYRKDGSSFWNALSITPLEDFAGRVTHFVGVHTDVTARRRVEEQFRQAQKMEAPGRLAGGIAHDFNNLLTVINGYSQILLQRASDADPAREYLELINTTGERAAALTRQ